MTDAVRFTAAFPVAILGTAQQQRAPLPYVWHPAQARSRGAERFLRLTQREP